MSRAPKIKIVAARMLAPKAPRVGALVRRAFPAWIDASECAVAFNAKAVTPRVRDGLVLRMIGRAKQPTPRKPAHGPGAR